MSNLLSHFPFPIKHFLLLFLLLFSFSTFAANPLLEKSEITKDIIFKKLVYRGYECLYNFEFTKADSVISHLKKNYAAEPLSHLLNANYYWWLILSGEDTTENRQKYLQELEVVLTMLKKKSSDALANEELYFLISSYALNARLDLMNKNYFKALFHVKDCIDYMKISFGKEDKFEPFYLTSGLYNYFTDYGMKHYSLLYPTLIFFPKGSCSTGIRWLEKTTVSQDILLNTEGNYFLMKIYFELEKNYTKAQEYAAFLTNRYKKNLLYQYLHFKILIDSGKKSEALLQLEELHIQAILNPQLSEKQKKYFIQAAQKDLINFYQKMNKKNEK